MNPIVDLPEPLLLGLHALVALARTPESVLSARTIADEMGASEGHLAKVLQKLARSGILAPVHGPGGGYKMAKAPRDINMRELVELLGGPFTQSGCGFEGCRDKPCLIGALVDELTAAIRDYMERRTLDDLLEHFEAKPEITIGLSLDGPDSDKKVISDITKN